MLTSTLFDDWFAKKQSETAVTLPSDYQYGYLSHAVYSGLLAQHGYVIQDTFWTDIVNSHNTHNLTGRLLDPNIFEARGEPQFDVMVDGIVTTGYISPNNVIDDIVSDSDIDGIGIDSGKSYQLLLTNTAGDITGRAELTNNQTPITVDGVSTSVAVSQTFASTAQLNFVHRFLGHIAIGAELAALVLADPGVANQTLSVDVDLLGAYPIITVNLATDGGSAITTTADDVVAAIRADGVANTYFYIDAVNGTGVVEAMAETFSITTYSEPTGLPNDATEYSLNVKTVVDGVNTLTTVTAAGSAMQTLNDVATVIEAQVAGVSTGYSLNGLIIAADGASIDTAVHAYDPYGVDNGVLSSMNLSDYSVFTSIRGVNFAPGTYTIAEQTRNGVTEWTVTRDNDNPSVSDGEVGYAYDTTQDEYILVDCVSLYSGEVPIYTHTVV